MKISFGEQLNNVAISYFEIIKKPSRGDFFELEDVIVGKLNGTWIAYDRICDHNGGLLCLDKNKKTATCPIHKWTLMLQEKKYDNNCPKIPCEVVERDVSLEIKKFKYTFPEIFSANLTDSKIEIDFNAHASVTFEINGIKLTSDPWFVGSCFATGWWHLQPPSEEAIKRLISSDYIYISHNHPDHLHAPTLEKYVNKNTPIIVPNFKSKSVESRLRKIGYANLIIVDFLKELIVHTPKGNFKIIIIKSGDDRDDSSLIITTKENKILLGVDTNMPNKWVLPAVDLLFTAFAGGASGFPSRVENFSLSKKEEIIKSNKLSVFNNHVKKLVSSTSPKYVVPYAGFFTETSRDAEVKKINIKNSPEELISFVEDEFGGVKGFNPLAASGMVLHGNSFVSVAKNEMPSYFLDDEYVEEDIFNFVGANYKISDKYLSELGSRYLDSNYFGDLTIVFLPSSVDFRDVISKALVIDFSKTNRSFKLIDFLGVGNEDIVRQLQNPNVNNIELLRVRADTMVGVFNAGLPIEDLSIGFQIKMYRSPNVYNFGFWSHFTNDEFIQLSFT